jgi:hypothetical protein
MNTYQLRVRPIHRLTSHGWHSPELNTGHLVSHLPGVNVRGLSSEDPYHWVVDLQLARGTHDDALNEIFVAVQLLGFEVVNAWVTEWADRSVEGALLGLAGGGTAGAASVNADLAALIALVASVLGGLVGSQLKRVEKVYELTPTFPSGWVLTPVPLPEPGEPVLRPGFSPA